MNDEIFILLSDATVAVQFSFQKIGAAHQPPNICHGEAPTPKSPRKTRKEHPHHGHYSSQDLQKWLQLSVPFFPSSISVTLCALMASSRKTWLLTREMKLCRSGQAPNRLLIPPCARTHLSTSHTVPQKQKQTPHCKEPQPVRQHRPSQA